MEYHIEDNIITEAKIYCENAKYMAGLLCNALDKDQTPAMLEYGREKSFILANIAEDYLIRLLKLLKEIEK